MATRSELTEHEIRARSEEKVYARGQALYRDGAVIDTVRRGNELEAYCEGSMPSPYHIQVTLDNTGIVSATCNCEYDWGGDCKHIVAVLLTYLNGPEAFEQRALVQDVLAGRSKDDLITLIREMIARHPELSVLVDRPVPGSQKRNTPINTESFRRELRHAMNTYEGWGDTTPAATLTSIAKTADQFARQGDWLSASAIYDALLEESGAEGDYPFDDDGEFVSAVNDIVEDLTACLDQPDIINDNARRQAILLRLIDVQVWDMKIGGIGIGDSIEITEVVPQYAKPQDLPLVRAKLQAAKENFSSSWSQDLIEEILAEVDLIDNVDPELVLNRLRDEERYELLFERLLKLNRTDEAISVARTHLTTPHDRVRVAWILAKAGQEDAAINLARETFDTQYDQFLGGWLIEAYKRRGDENAYFEVLRQQMLASPHEQHYVELKAAAEVVGKWESLRPEIFARLRKTKQFTVLVEIYLHDEEWDAAWQTLERDVPSDKSQYSWLSHGLDLKVASRSRHVRPAKALPIYVRYARRHIDLRNREDYRTAVDYLAIARDLYQQLGDEESWRKLIAGIRAEFPKLRALQEELNKARL